MKVIFTCGGTAGHVNPALALAGYMRKRTPRCSILIRRRGARTGARFDRAHGLSVPYGQHFIVPPLVQPRRSSTTLSRVKNLDPRRA